MKRFVFLKIILAQIFLCAVLVGAQDKARVEVFAQIKSGGENNKCETNGKFAALPKPLYPKEAKLSGIGGTVEIETIFDDKGKVLFVKNVYSAQKILTDEAINAAQRTKFRTLGCAAQKERIFALLTFNFLPEIAPKNYFVPAKTTELLDVSPSSRVYESIFDLTENHRLLFAFDDRRFYPDAPLTRGDFAHFLRSTLDLLTAKAVEAKKDARELNLYFSYKPKNINADQLNGLDKTQPFADSFQLLLSKYEIDLSDGENRVFPNQALTVNEVLDLWNRIFGVEAVPVNFLPSPNERRLMTRGDFALFLDESLQVLEYKVLP